VHLACLIEGESLLTARERPNGRGQEDMERNLDTGGEAGSRSCANGGLKVERASRSLGEV